MAATFIIVIIILGFNFLKWLLPIIRDEIEYRSPGLCGKVWLAMGILGFMCILLKIITKGA